MQDISHEQEITYYTARKTQDVESVIALADKPKAGIYIIDDFHRLSQDMQTRLADIAKIAADEGEAAELPKLIFIGINQVGASLIHFVPDIAKRCGIHRIEPGSMETSEQLIIKGCELLNIVPFDVKVIYDETKGDYWLSQSLCQAVCLMNDLIETSDKPKQFNIDLTALRESVVKRLESFFSKPVTDFCRGKRFRPSNDPYFRLLKAVAQQESSTIDLNQLANLVPDARGSINNLKEKRLPMLLETKPDCGRYFYYDSETKFFAIEDPALSYYLKHLDWVALRNSCGFKQDIPEYEYDVAISFAGENRDLAREVAIQLEDLDMRVFFDENYETNFLGKTWGKEFERIFGHDSRLVLCLLDVNHNKKIWPTFEREHFTPRVADEAVIPIFLDDTVFIGIPKDLIGIKFKFDPAATSLHNAVADQISLKVFDRLG